jgi:signal transduction histidine kinase
LVEEVVSLTIEDRGPGIAATDLPHIFEPFYRAGPSRAPGVGGVGLGLAVAARIVAAMDGRLDVQTAPGQGSRFRILLLAAPPSDDKPGPTC